MKHDKSLSDKEALRIYEEHVTNGSASYSLESRVRGLIKLLSDGRFKTQQGVARRRASDKDNEVYAAAHKEWKAPDYSDALKPGETSDNKDKALEMLAKMKREVALS